MSSLIYFCTKINYQSLFNYVIFYVYILTIDFKLKKFD